jgi:hypothetical protein
MDRASAARVLGVELEASAAQIEAAYRAGVHAHHPDRFPAESAQWHDASRAMADLNDARRAMLEPATAAAAEHHDVDRTYDVVLEPWDRATVTPLDAVAADRSARLRAWTWGALLLVSSLVSYLVGAQSSTNDALPLWSPALALIGVVALVIGWRAHRRLRTADRPAPGPRS